MTLAPPLKSLSARPLKIQFHFSKCLKRLSVLVFVAVFSTASVSSAQSPKFKVISVGKLEGIAINNLPPVLVDITDPSPLMQSLPSGSVTVDDVVKQLAARNQRGEPAVLFKNMTGRPVVVIVNGLPLTFISHDDGKPQRLAALFIHSAISPIMFMQFRVAESQVLVCAVVETDGHKLLDRAYVFAVRLCDLAKGGELYRPKTVEIRPSDLKPFDYYTKSAPKVLEATDRPLPKSRS